MQYFLFLIILGLCSGGYYEYTALQQKSAAADQQLADLGSKVNTLAADNKTLTDDNIKLAQSVKADDAKIAELTKALADAQKTATASPLSAATATPTGSVPTAPGAHTNNLGTITTSDGKAFQKCQLLKVEADGIVINDADGITKLVYGKLPADLEKRFGYDPLNPALLTDDQIQALEQQRVADQAAGK